LQASVIPEGDIQQGVKLMGVVVALQWPLSYGSNLMGLQKQVLRNTVAIPMSTVSNGGAVLLLCLYSPTISVFFAWQVLIAAGNVAIVTVLMWRSLPRSGRAPCFEGQAIDAVSVVTLPIR
jgi:hypothetical protein